MRVNSKAEQLAEHFEQLIDQGVLTEGQYLGTKSDLMQEHQVAAGTLNEAMRLLQTRGYINVKSGPKGGAFVSGNTQRVKLRHTLIRAIGDPQEISDVIKIRDELEVLVAVEAARSCTPADAERILAAEQIAASEAPGQARLLKIWDLHREIARTGKNAILSTFYISLLDTLTASIGEVETRSTVPQGVNDDTVQVHRNLVQAVVSNDIEAAVAAARAHTPIGKDYYLNSERGL